MRSTPLDLPCELLQRVMHRLDDAGESVVGGVRVRAHRLKVAMHGVEPRDGRRIELRFARDEMGGLRRGLGRNLAELTRMSIHAFDQTMERGFDLADLGKLWLGLTELAGDIGNLA